MSLQENKDVVQRIVDLLNDGKLEQARALYADDYCNHDPGAPAVQDREALMQTFIAWGAAFPDAHTTIEGMVAEGDKVAKRWTYRGTHTGEFMGIPPTGKAFEITATTIYRLSGGKVAECWWYYDSLGLLQQIGVIPPMGEG
jgi:steroid delta-isomerase-like uncharacterized protein